MKSHSPVHRLSGRVDLTQGSTGRHLIRLTIPMIWGTLAIISFQLINMYYIGRLGAFELSAISFTFPVTYGVFSLTLGMGIATSSVIARQLGAGRLARARRLTTHALALALLMGLLFAVLGLSVMDPLFRALGAPPDMMPLIHDYMTIWFLGCFLINTPLVGNAAIRATGDTLFPAIVMTFAALCNAALDPLLIFGLWGFPALGVKGAAISTVIANALALLAGLYVIAIRKRMLARGVSHWRLFGDSARRLGLIAAPAGLATVIQPVTNAVIVSLLAGAGTQAVAAYGVVTRVEAFAFVIIMGLASGMAPLIGQNWGAGRFDRVAQAIKQAIGFAVIWSLIVSVVLVLGAQSIAGAFTDDPVIIKIAASCFWITALTYAAGNLTHGWASAFNAMGRPEGAFTMIFVKMIVITLPLAWIGMKLYGPLGVFAAIAIANLGSGLGVHLLCRRFILRRVAAQIPSSAS